AARPGPRVRRAGRVRRRGRRRAGDGCRRAPGAARGPRSDGPAAAHARTRQPPPVRARALPGRGELTPPITAGDFLAIARCVLTCFAGPRPLRGRPVASHQGPNSCVAANTRDLVARAPPSRWTADTRRIARPC